MNKKSAAESLSQKMELINKKVREINERRRGTRTTHIEDDLDRQELKTYVRLMGIEQGDIRLESAENETYAPRNNIFYATVAIEGLIEIVLLYIALSYLLMPNPGTNEYIMAAVLFGIFGYLGYTIYRALYVK